LGIRMPPLGVDMMTVGHAILALIASIKVNFFYNKKNI
jgi:hypothetical protein